MSTLVIQRDADYSALLVEPALAIIRNRLLLHRPPNVGEYISQYHSQIRSEIEAAFAPSAGTVVVTSAGSLLCEPSAPCGAASSSTAAAPTSSPAMEAAAAAIPDPTSAPAVCGAANPSSLAAPPAASLATAGGGGAPSGGGGKYDSFAMPSGRMDDFHKGLASRIGFPHLEFEKTMEAEHCSMAGCDMQFTTRNYGGRITTTARAEWGVVVRGEAPPEEHMLNDRVKVPVEEKLRLINEQFTANGLDVRLRREEVIAVILYTGPMYMLYNCVLAQWSDPAVMWDTLRSGNNRFTTTLSVLVSAVQKLSSITVIPDGLKLYRGTGGRFSLPEYFLQPDKFNCRGMTEWGFMSCSADKQVAIGYSGAAEGRPHAMVLEIEPSCVDRGAVVSEISQYPKEVETLFLPMSYVAPTGEQRVERSAKGDITVVPVRVSVNLKAERLEQLEEKKKSIHLTGFEFRVNEVRQRLQRLADEGGAEARLKDDFNRSKQHWGNKKYSVELFLEAQVAKVEDVLSRHRARAAAEYSDDDVYRRLVSESLEVARMAESALLWWLRDKGAYLNVIQGYSLHEFHRHFESFLTLECGRVAGRDGRRAAALELCRHRGLLRADANECDENGETPLIALAARGGSTDDVRLLHLAGALLGNVSEKGWSAMQWAASQGHAEVVAILAQLGVTCNQANKEGETALWLSSLSGHLRCVETLLQVNAAVNQEKIKVGSTPLHMASQEGHLEVVIALLRGGADVTLQRGISCATPLFLASENGHRDVVDALICSNADVNLARKNGATPLYVASQRGHYSVVDTLIRGNADVNKSRDNGTTPLYVSIENGHRDIVDALLRSLADVSIHCQNDVSTPLLVASQNGHSDIVDALLRGKANANTERNRINGATPLFLASENGHRDVVDVLLRSSANPNQAKYDRSTPLNVASKNGHTACVEALLRFKADLTLAWRGQTPLDSATKNEHADVVHVPQAAAAAEELARGAAEAP